MSDPHVQTSPPLLSPRLPLEIIYLIAELGSFRLRLSLVRCSRSLYRACRPLVSQEIVIDTAEQLSRLSRTPDVVAKLATTRTIFLGQEVLGSKEDVFDPESRAGNEQIARCFFDILVAATSLCRVEIIERSSGEVESGVVISETPVAEDVGQRRPFIPATPFHMLMMLLKDILGDNVAEIRNTELVVAYHRQKPRRYQVQFFLKCASPERWCPYQYLSTNQAGRLIRQSIGGHSCAALQALNLTFGDKDDGIDVQRLPLFFSWIRDVLLVVGCSSIVALSVQFEDIVPLWPLRMVHDALVKIYHDIPSLGGFAIYGHADWYRLDRRPIEFEGSSCPTSLVWVPCPSYIGKCPGVLEWWLDALGIKISATHTLEDREEVVEKLQRAMSYRSNPYVPKKDELLRLLYAYQRGV